MNGDPWTSDDPQPGDFDSALEAIDPSCVDHHDRDPAATLRMLVSVEGDDVARLERIAARCGLTPRSVIADLLRGVEE